MPRNNPFNEHTLSIMQAALPHVNYQAQSSMNVILKANELMSTLSELSSPSDLSAMELDEEQQNPEVLLQSLKPVCNPAENEFIDMILNFMGARRIFSAYQDYTQNVVHSQDVGNNQRNSQRSPFGMNRNGNLMDFLLSQMPPEQRSTFETLSMLLNSMPSNMNSGQTSNQNSTQNTGNQPT